jgi:hypothetical protein
VNGPTYPVAIEIAQSFPLAHSLWR